MLSLLLLQFKYLYFHENLHIANLYVIKVKKTRLNCGKVAHYYEQKSRFSKTFDKNNFNPI